jgi:hypothetical protein
MGDYILKAKGIVKELLKRVIRKQSPSINNYYLTTTPCPQNAIDIFKGEWSSRFPPPLDNLNAGTIELFEDVRLKWFISEVGGLQGKQILELGPLEGGHSYMLEKHGAESIIAIEANTHAYLRCLIAKELLGMQRVRFLSGDFIEYLKDPACPRFDIGVASGVLYHMVNPVELISLLAKSCQTHLFIWTHYYDKAWGEEKKLQRKFPFAQSANYADFSHTLIRQYYDSALNWTVFCGGSRPYSHWMYRDEIIQCLKYFDFSKIKINFDQPDHPNGPAFTLLASRP